MCLCNGPFVAVGDVQLSYHEFQESLKLYRDISDRVMSAYCAVFDDTPRKYLFGKSDRKKIALSPFSWGILFSFFIHSTYFFYVFLT